MDEGRGSNMVGVQGGEKIKAEAVKSRGGAGDESSEARAAKTTNASHKAGPGDS